MRFAFTNTSAIAIVWTTQRFKTLCNLTPTPAQRRRD